MLMNNNEKKRDNETRLPSIKSRFYEWPQKFWSAWIFFEDILSVRATLITVFQKLFQKLAKYKIKFKLIKFKIVKGEPIYWSQFYSSISLVALAKAAISAANSWKSTDPLLSWSSPLKISSDTFRSIVFNIPPNSQEKVNITKKYFYPQYNCLINDRTFIKKFSQFRFVQFFITSAMFVKNIDQSNHRYF